MMCPTFSSALMAAVSSEDATTSVIKGQERNMSEVSVTSEVMWRFVRSMEVTDAQP